MKYLILYIFSALFLVSCRKDDTCDCNFDTDEEYKIINYSGYDIKINAYYHDFKNYVYVKKTYNIPKSTDNTEFFRKNTSDYASMDKILAASRVEIIYNNEKLQKWLSNDTANNRNLLHRRSVSNHKIIHSDDKLTKYEYIFTPQDYQDATSCNGNCE